MSTGPEVSDIELLRAIAGGDRAAFEVFYRRHAPWLIVRLRRRCPDESLVDDVVQETFLSVWRGAARFRLRDAEAAAWLWRIGSRRLIDATRQSGARQRLIEVLERRQRPTEPSAEDRVLVDIAHGDIGGALQRLSPELRAVIQATVVDNLSTRDAAALLGIPVGTVKTRAMRARQQLRAELT